MIYEIFDEVFNNNNNIYIPLSQTIACIRAANEVFVTFTYVTKILCILN